MGYDRTLLSEEALHAFLVAHPLWKREAQTLLRTYAFGAFLHGIEFVRQVAELAEARNHHPDIDIRWRNVTLRLTTHDAGGLTFRDTELAAACESLFRG
jgi:4a-hydroxytetrahydrobiopterin dehydratase